MARAGSRPHVIMHCGGEWRETKGKSHGPHACEAVADFFMVRLLGKGGKLSASYAPASKPLARGKYEITGTSSSAHLATVASAALRYMSE